MIEYAISACLCGKNVRYDGRSKEFAVCRKLVEEGKAIMICPEVMGGMSIPRNPCEIKDGRVVDNTGKDQTEYFLKGCKEVEAILEKYPTIHTLIIKEGSPSCGSHRIYDGTFSGTCIPGKGMLLRNLKKELRVLNEEELDKI